VPELCITTTGYCQLTPGFLNYTSVILRFIHASLGTVYNLSVPFTLVFILFLNPLCPFLRMVSPLTFYLTYGCIYTAQFYCLSAFKLLYVMSSFIYNHNSNILQSMFAFSCISIVYEYYYFPVYTGGTFAFLIPSSFPSISGFPT
jgi:hypothetical protein